MSLADYLNPADGMEADTSASTRAFSAAPPEASAARFTLGLNSRGCRTGSVRLMRAATLAYVSPACWILWVSGAAAPQRSVRGRGTYKWPNAVSRGFETATGAATSPNAPRWPSAPRRTDKRARRFDVLRRKGGAEQVGPPGLERREDAHKTGQSKTSLSR
jgi:hypothetical protein